jgi:hypothetical protein
MAILVCDLMWIRGLIIKRKNQAVLLLVLPLHAFRQKYLSNETVGMRLDRDGRIIGP